VLVEDDQEIGKFFAIPLSGGTSLITKYRWKTPQRQKCPLAKFLQILFRSGISFRLSDPWFHSLHQQVIK